MATRKRAPARSKLEQLSGQKPDAARDALRKKHRDTVIETIRSGKTLDVNMRVSIVHQLEYLGWIEEELSRKAGRRVEWPSWAEAAIVRVLVDEYGVSVKTALRCVLSSGDEKTIARVKRTYEKIRAGAPQGNYTPPAGQIQGAINNIPLSAKRNKQG